MNTREQYLQKRVEALEAALRLAYEEMFVAQFIIERVESVANAFAFDLAALDLGQEGALVRWTEAQEKARVASGKRLAWYEFSAVAERVVKEARADSDKARGIQRNPDGTIAFIDPEKFSGRKP